MTDDTHESIITRLMAEARIAQDESHKRSARAKQAWIARRERASAKRPASPS